MRKRRLPYAASGIRRGRGPKGEGSNPMRRRLQGLLAALLLTAPAPVGATTVAYWRFEEGTVDTQASGAGSILDETANNNDGTPNGNPFYRSDVPANPGPLTGAANALSLQLDGNGDYVGIPHSTSLDLSDGFTVEFWMKGNPTQGESQYLVIDKSHGWTDSTGWAFQGSTSTGALSFLIGNGVGGVRWPPTPETSTSVLRGTARWPPTGSSMASSMRSGSPTPSSSLRSSWFPSPPPPCSSPAGWWDWGCGGACVS